MNRSHPWIMVAYMTLLYLILEVLPVWINIDAQLYLDDSVRRFNSKITNLKDFKQIFLHGYWTSVTVTQ